MTKDREVVVNGIVKEVVVNEIVNEIVVKEIHPKFMRKKLPLWSSEPDYADIDFEWPSSDQFKDMAYSKTLSMIKFWSEPDWVRAV